MKKVIIIFCLLVSVVTVNARTLSDQPIEIKLGRELLGQTPTIEVVVNGKVRNFYFDTGGGISFISPEIAKEIGCTPFGGPAGYNAGGMKFTIQRCEDIEMKIGAFTIKRDVGVLDPAPFFPNAKGKIDGSIALDAFDNRVLTVDLTGDRLFIENEKSLRSRIKHMKPMAARLSREVAGSALDIFVGANTPKGKIWMLLDTGNTNKLLFTKSAQDQLGISLVDANGEKIIKPVKVDLIGIGEMEADGRERDMIYDGMLSYEVIKQLLFTVDFRTGKMWAKLNR